MTQLRSVTSATFDEEVLASGLPVVVDFWAEWCAPCRALAPVLEEFARIRAETASVVKVDVEAEQALAARYAVISLPTIKVFRDGEVVASLSGAMPRAALEAALAEHLG